MCAGSQLVVFSSPEYIHGENNYLVYFLALEGVFRETWLNQRPKRLDVLTSTALKFINAMLNCWSSPFTLAIFISLHSVPRQEHSFASASRKTFCFEARWKITHHSSGQAMGILSRWLYPSSVMRKGCIHHRKWSWNTYKLTLKRLYWLLSLCFYY